jgi:ribose 5-phosphate isomerase B
MVIAFGNDHAGFPLRDVVKTHIERQGHRVVDHGTHTADPVDFPDIVALVCGSIREGVAQRGVLVCGTGVGACIAANKTPTIRAAVCHDIYSSHQCVEHDDVNVLCVGAQVIGPDVAKALVTSFLEARFSTEEHFRRRVRKLHDLELRSGREVVEGRAND